MKRRSHLSGKYFFSVMGGLCLLFLIAFLIALCKGSENIPLSHSLLALYRLMLGQASGLSWEDETILITIRLPRACFAILAGASLSVAGAAFQALLRNPLAEPYVLGVSSGAAVGAILSIIFFSTFPLSQPVAAFLGAIITVVVVYLLGQGKAGASTERLILAGVITTSFLWATIIFLLTLNSSSRLRGLAFWLMGDLSSSTTLLLGVTAAIAIVGILATYLLARHLNLIMIGEESALSLGVSVEKIKLLLYLLASLLTGATVAVAGSIGYIGLIVPHIIRMAWTSDHRLVIPASALLGATLLLLADTVARTIIAPRELPVGAITAIIGAPLFVYLLRRIR